MANKEQKEAKVIEMQPKVTKEDVEVAEEAQVVEEPQVVEEQEKESPKPFKFGKLMIKCGHCGATYTLDDGVKNGIQLPALYAIEGARFTLACKECNNSMSLYFEEGSEKLVPKNEDKNKGEDTNDELQEDNKG